MSTIPSIDDGDDDERPVDMPAALDDAGEQAVRRRMVTSPAVRTPGVTIIVVIDRLMP
jgi:hypothetical protein